MGSKGLTMRAQTKGNSLNDAKGHKQQAIKIRQIYEAESQARELELLAQATAQRIALIAQAINMPDGRDAVNLRVAEQHVGEFGKLTKTSTTMIIPSNMSDIGDMVTSLSNLLERGKSGAGP
jgi:hypothetical protein